MKFFNVGRTWTVKCNPEYGLILVLSLSDLYTNTNIGNLENTLSVFFWVSMTKKGRKNPLKLGFINLYDSSLILPCKYEIMLI